MAAFAGPGYLVRRMLCKTNERSKVSYEEDWVCEAQGRKVIVRVRLDRTGSGATILRYAIEDGPAQAGIDVAVASREEARQWVQGRVEQLLGPIVGE